MRWLPLLLLLTACTPEIEPFTITVVNLSDSVLWMEAQEAEDAPYVSLLQKNQLLRWTPLAASLPETCLPACGAPPDDVDAAQCRDLPLFPREGDLFDPGFALLPGESASRSYPAELWSVDEDESCAEPVPVGQQLRLLACFGIEARNRASQDPVPQPVDGGIHDVVGRVVDCAEVDLRLGELRDLTLSLEVE